MDLFRSIQQPAAVADWFRKTLLASTGHQQKLAQARAADLQGQLGDVRRQQERLLNLHLAGSIDGSAFGQKNTELRDRLAVLTAEVEANDRGSQEKADLAMKVFELSQSLPQKWVKANSAEKRRILNMVCLNITLDGVSLSVATRKPFNALVKGLQITESGEGESRVRKHLFCRDLRDLSVCARVPRDWAVAVVPAETPQCSLRSFQFRATFRAGFVDHV